MNDLKENTTSIHIFNGHPLSRACFVLPPVCVWVRVSICVPAGMAVGGF